MRWKRGTREPVVTTRVCPACNTQGLVRHVVGQVCASCEAQRAWDDVAREGPLVIDRRSLDEAVQRRRGEIREARGKRLLATLPPLASVALAGVSDYLLVVLLSPRPIGPLHALFDDLSASQAHALWTGIGIAIVGLVGLVRARRGRHHRRVLHLVGHASALVIGCITAIAGGLHTLATADRFSGAFTSMPERELTSFAPQVERIFRATAVVLATDAEGDARYGSIGTGIVVGGKPDRAWILTCSHVAMPYDAVGTFRHAADALPVWVQLADGREGRGTVQWVAEPPLDLALVELRVKSPPEPVPIAADASSLQPSADVMFVPNPYRAGWKLDHGTLVRREPHTTPAGTFELLITALPVIPGDSGSGLFDSRGQLVGLNTWTRINVGYANGISLPAEAMHTLVDALARGELGGAHMANQE